MCAVVGCVWGVVWYVKYRWRREEEETRQMYDMVERIIGKKTPHTHTLQTGYVSDIIIFIITFMMNQHSGK